MGKMPLVLELLDAEGSCIDQLRRDSDGRFSHEL
jgi:hypothetical protein